MSIAYNEPPPPYDLSNFTVLLAEDSEYMSSLMCSMLKAFGVGDILTCKDANEAIGILTITRARKKSRFVTDVDIVITDWLMPGGSGDELIDWIRGHEDDALRFMPIILISAYTTEKVIEMARDHGANESMAKPLSAKRLASRICNVIDSPRPFIQAPGYFGPDRRRHEMVWSGLDKRKTESQELRVHNEKL
ncbi:MAG: response regulator [Micavibrio sp.]|nr:MAG: response regulator [Micavibrio sp.]